MSETTPRHTGAPPVTAVAILGNDAVLAARPATAVQLAHACGQLGFEAALPGSWGDELVASEFARQLASRSDGGAILCACPHVEAALLAPGPDLAPLLVPTVAPPVAAALYLRHLYGDRALRITYVGRCPAAATARQTIDEQIDPDAFLRLLDERGVRLADQPTVFDSVLPPDRRRHCSLPGGMPSPSCLWDDERTRTLVEIESEDFKAELAQHLIARRRAVIDLAPRLGCACSGAAAPAAHSNARAAVMATEPPRAASPVVEVPAELRLSRRIPLRPAAPSPPRPPAPRPSVPDAPREVPHATELAGDVASTRAPDRLPERAWPEDATRQSAAPRTPADAPPASAPRRGDDLAPPRRTPEPPPPPPPGRARKTTSSGIFRAHAGHVPTTRSAEGRPLPRAYAAHRKSPRSNPAIVPRDEPPTRAANDDVRASVVADAVFVATLDATRDDSSAEAPDETRDDAIAEAPSGAHREAPVEVSVEIAVETRADAAVDAAPADVSDGVAPEPPPAAERGEEEPRDVARHDDEPAIGERLEDDASAADEVVVDVEEVVVHHDAAEAAARAAVAHVVVSRDGDVGATAVVTTSGSTALELHRQPTAFRLPPPRRRRVGRTVGILALLAAAAAAAAITVQRTRQARAGDADVAPPAAAATLSLPPAPAAAPSPGPVVDSAVLALPPAADAVTDSAAAPAPRPRRRARRGGRRGADAVPPPVSAPEEPPPPALVAPATAAAQVSTPPPAPDAVGRVSVFPVVPRPDGIPARPAGQGLTIGERDSIQREILRRRARSDSLQRRLDSVRSRS